MDELQVHVLKPGMYSTLQDQGRNGFQNKGVPQGGALDRKAANDANKIVGNNDGCPVIEVTILGPELDFTKSCFLAITGANLNPTLNQKAIKNYELIEVPENAHLSFGKVESGCRAYIAIAGAWQVEKWLGSASAASFNPTELTPESLLSKGSIIKIAQNRSKPQPINNLYPPAFSNVMRVRLIAGPEFDWFSRETIGKFFSRGHRLSQQSNRMGCQLLSKFPSIEIDQELISSGIIPGTIQVTRQGNPIILLADGQTTGGYPRIGNIIDEDLDIIAQLKPGDEIWFSLIE